MRKTQLRLSSLFLVLLFAGVAVFAYQQFFQKPKLSGDEILALADEFAKNNVPGFELENFPDRTAEYDAESNSWWIMYIREPSRWPGDHFSVTIDDATNQIEMVGGM